MKGLLRWFIARTRPFVQRCARAYSLRVDEPFRALGDWPLVLDEPVDVARRSIPASVMFNTRSGSIRIGAECVFGEEVMLLTGKHLNVREAAETNRPLHSVPESGRDIVIGRGCYVGSRAIVIGPAVVGDFAVIGAGAVVTRDVPAYTFVAGVPAKVISDLRPAAPISSTREGGSV
jgi:acetyltransferase-like isoleucine patch superfamily enzyme